MLGEYATRIAGRITGRITSQMCRFPFEYSTPCRAGGRPAAEWGASDPKADRRGASRRTSAQRRRFDRPVSRFVEALTSLYAATSDLLGQRPQLAARFAASRLSRAALRAVSSSIGTLSPSP